MASGPITSWEIDGETVETVSDFIFPGLQNHCRWCCHHEIKRHLLLGRKVMTNLDSILKSRVEAVYCHPAYLTYTQHTSSEINTRLNETQAGIKIAGRNINNFRYADDTTLMAESEEELKRLLMKVKEESEKVGLTLNIQKMKIMASGPITSWQIEGETVKTVSDFILGGSKITSDSDCSHEIKRCLLLGRKVMTNLDSILKSRDITLPKKVRLLWYSCSYPLPVSLLA